MKKLILFPVLLFSTLLFAQSGFQQPGYEIKVTVKPFKNQFVYLGHYSGKQYPVVDSVKLNDKSEGTFKGSRTLGGGIYIVVYPERNKFFELLIDKQQHFSVIVDTATLATTKKFINSPDNVLFDRYQHFMNAKGKTMDSARNMLQFISTAKDTATLNAIIQKTNNDVSQFRRQFVTANPDNILTMLLRLMDEPQIPPAEKHPGGKYDSAFAYRYFKDHFWDGIGFWDERICRTPASLFEDKLDKYYNTLVFPAADSVIKEIDWMLGYASVSKELTRFLLVKFVTRYLNMKYMWEDAVFVHIYEKYFAQKTYDWLTEQGKKIITERAYSLMANLTGNPAENISLPDTAGAIKTLYTTNSPYTIVCFWDPTCGHCKETLPVLDSMYRAKWKSYGVRFFTIAKESEGGRKDWLEFIRSHGIHDWVNVYYSKDEEKTRINANVPGYSQLYDVQSYPTVYLLDKDKRIVAKKVTWQQMDEILELRMKKKE